MYQAKNGEDACEDNDARETRLKLKCLILTGLLFTSRQK